MHAYYFFTKNLRFMATIILLIPLKSLLLVFVQH